MLHFTKLRLSGFKSFVESTDLIVEPGLTGVVGPNGCGKSNLVEAMRWVMGETSAKQMRGGEMDDVIFSGTSERPTRNVAEVVLSLDNSQRTAPAAFNDASEIEISRRIERGNGSTYRINGNEVRARDVQLLFADSATGARSTALVSQGRVNALIQAKPQQRRSLLEEAAGITGLHSRRHEAELRLRAAESNLERLDDVLIALEGQLQNLRKQARQATRYRNLSGHIRNAQATLYLLRWSAAQEDGEAARQELIKVEAEVAELTGRAAHAATARTESAALLPDLRRAESEAATELHRLTVARDGLDAELQRIETARADGQNRLDQVTADLERERLLAADALKAMEQLNEERERLEAGRAGEAAATAEAAMQLQAANEAVEATETRLTALTEQAAADEARRADLVRRIEELSTRRQRLSERAGEVTRQQEAVAAEAIDPEALLLAEASLAETRDALAAARIEVDAAEAARAQSVHAVDEGSAAFQKADAARASLEAESRALSDVLKTADSELFPPLIDAVIVEPGYETALGAALGEDLSAPADEPAPVHWMTLSPLSDAPSLPEGAEPLDRYVRGPAALRRRLSQIGVVDDAETGRRLAGLLRQGQRLVDREGGLWRWDGFTVASGAQTAAAARLEQRNRLAELREPIAVAKRDAEEQAENLRVLRAAAEAAQEAERNSRDVVRRADEAHTESRDRHAELRQGAVHYESQVRALAESAEALAMDIAEVDTQAASAGEALDALPDAERVRDDIAMVRAELTEQRNAQAECRSRHDRLTREAEDRARRLAEIGRETDSWRARGAGANVRMAELDQRKAGITAELERISGLPAEIAEKRQTLMTSIEQSEGKRRIAADGLAAGENTLAVADRAAHEADNELASARERRVRVEGRVEQCEQACHGLIERIAEQLECGPENLRELAGVKEDADLPELDSVEKRVERLLRERDTMGPVNLRAEQESQELTEQMENLDHERTDLVQAIEKLRRGINELNREGRERLLASFKKVDAHFQELFVRLFGGGQAHLELTDVEDPLEAGLEIMASPPGKRMQVLSLLSGGEQALTALALLFAVFLTNPAPICVLDEVDAPLDDANVDRFCSMVDEIAETSNTRFLIITHHRMTMTRMDRLFGVTMQERGVSQLVSVDLRRAEEIRVTA